MLPLILNFLKMHILSISQLVDFFSIYLSYKLIDCKPTDDLNIFISEAESKTVILLLKLLIEVLL